MNYKKRTYIFISFIIASTLTFISSFSPVDTTGKISYRLEWHWGQARPHEMGQGWQVTTDLGYKVQVTRGYLVTYSTELIECPADQAVTLSLFENLGVQPAYAGHGDELSPARITASYVESLREPIAIDLEAVSVPVSNYCQAHYLIGPAGSETSKNLPIDIDMAGSSLFIEGEYQATNQAKPTAFSLQYKLPDGIITDLATPNNTFQKIQATTGDGEINVIIQRDLGNIFNGVDFVTMSEADQAKAILRSLTEGTTVLITQGQTKPISKPSF